MLAIVTSFGNDAEHRARIVATVGGKHISVPYDRAVGLDDNHVTAALRLAAALGWRYEWVYARLESGDYCHVPLRPDRHYTTQLAPSECSPAEEWRGGICAVARRR